MQVAHENLHIGNLIIPHCLCCWFHSASNLPRTKGWQKYSHTLYRLGSCHLVHRALDHSTDGPDRTMPLGFIHSHRHSFLSKMLSVPGLWNLRVLHTSAWLRFTSPLASSHLYLPQPESRAQHFLLIPVICSLFPSRFCMCGGFILRKKSNCVIIEKLPSRICFISNEINCSNLCLWPWTDEFRLCWVPSWEQVQEFSTQRDKTFFDT